MKKIDIKGKSYVMVHERIMHFRETHKGWQLVSRIPVEVLPHIDEYCVVVTEIINDLGQVVATGHAFERQQDGFINSSSHVENCETSSWGRALANLGIGIEDGTASAEEVANAIKQQDEKPWLDHKTFNLMVDRLNHTANDEKRKELVRNIFSQYKVKKDYRNQFAELVEKRDINV